MVTGNISILYVITIITKKMGFSNFLHRICSSRVIGLLLYTYILMVMMVVMVILSIFNHLHITIRNSLMGMMVVAGKERGELSDAHS